MQPQTFRIEVPEREIEALRARLRAARSTPDFGNADWRYGTEGDYLGEVVDYWIRDYDWRAAEAQINAFDHYRVQIEGIPIHYLKKAGRGPAPLPLILTHGWPWTFWDYREVIEPLADPAAHGGDPRDAFDVIVPSLPGFAFSGPLAQTGVGWARTADLWASLMRDVLGYSRFAAGGGDWGAFVTAQLGHKYAPLLAGIHLTFPALVDLAYEELGEAAYAEEERDLYAQRRAMEAVTGSHMAVQCTDPQTLAYALNDSPLGLAAWILERRRNWSDCGGEVERAFSRDHLLTTLSLFWFTGSIGSSMRFYWENARQGWSPAHDRKPAIEAPTAMAIFPKDVFPIPQRVAASHANLQRWTRMPRGGHFAPAEAPELVVEDLRAFFRDKRDSG